MVSCVDGLEEKGDSWVCRDINATLCGFLELSPWLF
jgi:hypothetical protein